MVAGETLVGGDAGHVDWGDGGGAVAHGDLHDSGDGGAWFGDLFVLWD